MKESDTSGYDATDDYDNDEFFKWFLIASLSGMPLNDQIRSVPRNLRLTLNGQEINPLKAIKRLEQQFNSMVNDKASEIVQEHMERIQHNIDNIIEGDK